MENHPIPQDITGFQFKLIGNMTVRQFVYLAIGSTIAAFVFFILPIPFIIRLPVAVISVSIGTAFAFIPVGGRPMDTMVSNFFKALSAPTQYLYQKTGGNLSKTQNFADIETQTNAKNQVTTIPSVSPMDSSMGSINQAPPPILTLENDEPEQANPPEEELKVLLAQTQLQKEALEKEIENLKTQLNSQKQPAQDTAPNPIAPPQPASPPPAIPNAIPQPAAAAVKQALGLPIPESPNLITGIVNDPRGNPLQGVLVEVKDGEGNPVRAFKTNGLGRFAAATSLANGKYILVLEDPKGVNKFDSLQIEAVGNPIPPVQIISVDPREELRRSLFTNG